MRSSLLLYRSGRTSSTGLNGNGESGHGCVFVIYEDKMFSLSTLSMVLTMAFDRWRVLN